MKKTKKCQPKGFFKSLIHNSYFIASMAGVALSVIVIAFGLQFSPATEIPMDDQDLDGVPDFADNCPNDSNPGQEDFDCDAHGFYDEETADAVVSWKVVRGLALAKTSPNAGVFDFKSWITIVNKPLDQQLLQIFNLSENLTKGEFAKYLYNAMNYK